jgi:hypothetical protein
MDDWRRCPWLSLPDAGLVGRLVTTRKMAQRKYSRRTQTQIRESIWWLIVPLRE